MVSKVAGIAAREVSGVYDLGGGASRVVGALRERIPGSGTNLSQGVTVEVGEKQAAVDIDVVAEYGVSIADLAAGLRRNVIGVIQRMTGLAVTEVNVTVHDVFEPGVAVNDVTDGVTWIPGRPVVENVYVSDFEPTLSAVRLTVCAPGRSPIAIDAELRSEASIAGSGPV